MNPSRRRFLAGLSVLAVAPVLAACGSDGSDSGSDRQGVRRAPLPRSRRSRSPSSTSTARPRSRRRPKRVVCLGLTDQDALMALGVVPVGVTYWFGDEKLQGVYPWAQEYLGDAELPTVLKDTNGVEVEKVAALAPDLIIGAVRRPHRAGLQEAQRDGRPGRRAERRLRRLRHPVGRGGADPRHRDRQAEGGPGAHRLGQEADHRRGRRAPGVQGPDRRGRHAVRGPLPLRPRGPALADAAGPRLRPAPADHRRRRQRVRRLAQRRAHRRPRRHRRRRLDRLRRRQAGAEALRGHHGVRRGPLVRHQRRPTATTTSRTAS